MNQISAYMIPRNHMECPTDDDNDCGELRMPGGLCPPLNSDGIGPGPTPLLAHLGVVLGMKYASEPRSRLIVCQVDEVWMCVTRKGYEDERPREVVDIPHHPSNPFNSGIFSKVSSQPTLHLVCVCEGVAAAVKHAVRTHRACTCRQVDCPK